MAVAAFSDMESLKCTLSVETLKLPEDVIVIFEVRSLPVTTSFCVAELLVAVNPYSRLFVLSVRLGGGGVGELIRLTSSTVQREPSCVVDE